MLGSFLLVILCVLRIRYATTKRSLLKWKKKSLFCSERRFPILITSRLDCMFSCAAGCWINKKKIIMLFVFGKIEMYCSQNTDWIGIISACAAYCEAGADSRKMSLH